MADAAAEPAAEPAAPQQPAKVVVMFKATGDAPILKQNKFKARARAAAAQRREAATQAADCGLLPWAAGPCCCARGAQISATERFGKVVDFLRKQIQRESVVRAHARARSARRGAKPRGADARGPRAPVRLS